MKFNINVNQQRAEFLGLKSDLIDLSILDVMNYIAHKKGIEKREKDYYWVSVDEIRRNIPILHFTTNKAVNCRINNLIEDGLIERYNFNKSAQKSFFRFTDKALTYFAYDTQDETQLYIDCYLKNKCKNTATLKEIRNNKANIDWDIVEKVIKDMTYKDFLSSLYWKTIARSVKKIFKNKCALCGSSDSLNVHHRTYEHHGKEHKYYRTDLICLCKNCHSKFHDKIDNKYGQD